MSMQWNHTSINMNVSPDALTTHLMTRLLLILLIWHVVVQWQTNDRTKKHQCHQCPGRFSLGWVLTFSS